MRLRTVVVWSLVAVFGLGAQCSEGSSQPPPIAAKKPERGKEHLTVFVEGAGRHVWILLVVDARTRDVQSDFSLPYRRVVEASFGVKVEARNGSQDRGSISCKFVDARGVTVGTPQTAYGAGKFVTCVHDTTRA